MSSPALQHDSSSPQVSRDPAKEIREHLRPAHVTTFDSGLVDIGALAADDTINLRDTSRLRRFADDANSDDPHTAKAGMNALLGVATRFADLIAAGNANGAFKVCGALVTRSDLLYSFKMGRGKFVPVFHAISKTMIQLIEAAPGLRVGNAVSRTETTEAAPMKVEITGMPSRATTSTIERNQAGEITSTVQVEADL